MFGLFRSTRPQPKKSSPYQSRPRLEQLEDRYCPAAPVLTSFGAVTYGNWVTVYGQVSDESPDSSMVQISGALNASVTVESSGYFFYTDYHEGAGEVSAYVTDDENLNSDLAYAAFSPPPDNDPTIDFAVEYLQQRQIRIYGQVTDESPAYLSVQLSGSVNTTIYTDWSGAFDVTLTADALGVFTAYTQDAAGHGSNTPSFTLTSSAPTVADFNWRELSQGSYELYGQIQDESVSGLTVTFGSTVSSLQGMTTTTQANGSFSVMVQMTAAQADEAVISCTATDWWGLESDIYTNFLPDDVAPVIEITNVEYLEQRQVRVSGVVTDEYGEGLLVTFTGAANGSVYTGVGGSFVVTLTADSLGLLFASTTDAAQQNSNETSVTLTSTAPVISNFHCVEEMGGWYELQGNVDDESVAGLTIYFGGAPVSLTNEWCNVLADGTFCLRLQLNGLVTDEGTATALVTDWWGLESNLATCDVDQSGVG